MKRILTAIIIVTIVSIGGMALAEDKPTPSALKGGKVLTLEEMKTLLDAKGITLIDTRKALNFGKGHLKGAKNVPYKGDSENAENFDASKDTFDRSSIPTDKNAKIIFMSDGPTGWKSYKAAVTLIKEGYKNVMWFRSGTAEWEAKGLPMEK